MKEAIEKEWKSWVDSGAAVVIHRDQVPVGKQVLCSRAALTWKNVTEELGRVCSKMGK